MSDKNDELVLTVSASRVRALFGDRVWLDADREDLDESLTLEHLGDPDFVRRGDCETDTSKKQVIPYIILRCEGEYYRYTRSLKGGEDRLHAKNSIGVGGHINPDDEAWQVSETIRMAMNREFDEEICLGTSNCVDQATFAGLISDDSDAVGQVHLGVVLILDLANSRLRLRDEALCDGGWWSLDELREAADRLESWSRICVEHLAGKEVSQ